MLFKITSVYQYCHYNRISPCILSLACYCKW